MAGDVEDMSTTVDASTKELAKASAAKVLESVESTCEGKSKDSITDYGFRAKAD